MSHETEQATASPERPVSIDTGTVANGEPNHADAMATRTTRAGTSSRRAEPAAAQARPRGTSAFLNVLVSCIVGAAAGGGGAWYYMNHLNPPQPASASRESAAHVTPAPAAAPPAVSAEEFKELDKQVEHISGRLDKLQEHFAAIPKSVAPPDATEICNEILSQLRNDPTTAAIPGRLAALTERVAALEKSNSALRSALESLGKSGKKPETSRMPNPASSNPPHGAQLQYHSADHSMVATAIDQGAAMIKDGRYADAREWFGKLEEVHPDDARVWYLAALATGLATNNWDGEAKRLADKGVERERAGTPSSSRIDSALAGLTLPTGREWLAYYRRDFTH
jgi:hypothetical protein